VSTAKIGLCLMFTSCLSRSLDSADHRSQFLESRPPFPGETNDRPVMDAANYEPFTQKSNSFGRDGIESEAVQGVFGLSSADIIGFTNSAPGGGRSVYQRVSTPAYAKYFAIGTVVDDKVPWDEAAHAARESSPYVPLRTEDERLTVNAQGILDVSAGTDFMIDTYYDTPDFILLNNGILVRSRNRQDRPGVGRRALLQSKISQAPDGSGLKRVRKRDVRSEGVVVDNDLDRRLDESVKSGLNVLQRGTLQSAASDPLQPFVEIYKELNTRNLLPTLDGRQKVLLLNPQAVVFSRRARFHFGLTSRDRLVTYAKKGSGLIDEIAAAFEASQAPASAKEKVKALAENLDSANFLAQASLASASRDFSDATVAELETLTSINLDALTRRQAFLGHQVALTRRRLFQEFSGATASLGQAWDVKRRQLEYAGTAGLSLWFRKATATFGESLDDYSDFMIDSFDYVNAISHRDYAALTPGQKNMSEPLPPEKVFFASLTSDAQIELTEDVTFDKCLKNASDQPANQDLQKDKSMCNFLLRELDKSQTLVTQLRGQEVLQMAERAGLKGRVRWQNAEAAKGENALRIARDLPPPMPSLKPTPAGP
jgi:hypothetical protein